MLTRDDGAALARMLRTGQVAGELDWRAAVADKLEAEHEDVAMLRWRHSAVERGEALRDLLDALDANASWIHPHVSPVVARAREVLEGVERTHALVALADLAGAVHIIRGHANACEGAGLVDEARSHRAFADRIEVRAEVER